ncbi:MAG: hypothetical protein LBF12_06865 [Christensenellaceae bacterium]|nr:hypothetical protein [Christensenellaceae bacterium]
MPRAYQKLIYIKQADHCTPAHTKNHQLNIDESSHIHKVLDSYIPRIIKTNIKGGN